VAVAWVAGAGRPAVAGSINGAVPLVAGLVSVAAVALATVLIGRGREGWAFVSTGIAILAAMGAVFSRMFPAVLPASNRAANSITIGAAASQHNTLVVMTVVAAIFTPFVLAYQCWTYWVFRRRLTRPGAAAGSPEPVGPATTGAVLPAPAPAPAAAGRG